MNMGLGTALNIALAGLNVNQQALAVLSQNIANANTAGYTRKIVNQESVSINGVSSGVQMDTVTRKVDSYLQNSIQTQNSAVSQNTTIASYSSSIQILLGKPGDTTNIASQVGSFFNSLQTLSTNPSSTTSQQTVINSAQNLTSQMNNLASGLNGLQFQADQSITTTISAANTDITGINSLNQAIATQQVLGQSTANLQDKRDAMVTDLAKYIDIQTYPKSDGTINISTTSGISLLDSNLHQLSYNPVNSAASFANNAPISPIQVIMLDSNGNPIGTPANLVSGGTTSTITSGINSGTLAGLLNMRDQQIPAIISQLDNLAGNLRDSMNAISNAGTSYPGAAILTGQTAVSSGSVSAWSGNVQIAVLGANGQPAAGIYANQATTPTLNLNLANLNTGSGAGNPSVQGIINAINQNFTPQNKVEIGTLNNVSLSSNTSTLPSYNGQFNFNFNLDNSTSTTPNNVFVTGITLSDSNGVAMPAPTTTIPTIPLAGTYNTTAGSNTITINTTGTSNSLTNGEKIYLSQPSAAIDGIPTTDFGQYYTVSNVTGSSFDVTTASSAQAGGSFTVAGQTGNAPYASVLANSSVNSIANGTVTADLSSNTTSPYYTVNATVGVVDASGNVSTSTVSYRVNNNTTNLLNNNYGATAANGAGTIITPSTNQPVAQAMLVDANGNELPKINGVYVPNIPGYLVIKATGSSGNVIAINSSNSAELGNATTNPPIPASNKAFSDYFGLNNFFTNNTTAGVTTTNAGSAANLTVDKRLVGNPSLISTGTLTASGVTNNDNSTIQALVTLGNNAIAFSAAGGIGQTSQSFSAYAGLVIGAAATNASAATANQTNAQTLLTGYTTQASTVSGVNLDTELANTVIYQNAYSASARIVTVYGTMMDALLQAV